MWGRRLSHSAKAFRRSHLWDPAHHQDRTTFPSLMHVLLDETSGVPSDEVMRKKDADLEEEYQQTMY